MTIAKILGLAAKAGSRTKLGRKKPFKYHFVKGYSSFEGVSAYGEGVLGSRRFAYTFKSRKTPASKRRAVKRFKRVIHKSPSYKSQQRSLMEMRDDMAFGR